MIEHKLTSSEQDVISLIKGDFMYSWLLELPLRHIYRSATIKRVEPELIAAIVSVESGGNTLATRYEAHYRYILKEERFARRNRISTDTEIINQKTSWGLMQVMGGVAREHGFYGPLIKLTEPMIGLRYGIIHFTKFIDKYDDIPAAISAYNQGGDYKNNEGTFKNQKYVDKIMARYWYLKNL